MKKIVKGIGLKLITIGAIVILLLIGLSFIKSKTWDRERTCNYAKEEILNAAGGNTIIRGFYIDVPYKETNTVERWINAEKHFEKEVTKGTVTLEPEELEVKGKFTTQTRNLGIYSSPIFTGKIKIHSIFDMNLKDYGVREYEFNKAKIYLNIGEKNLSTRPVFNVNNTKYRTDFISYDSRSSVVKVGIPSKTGPLEISTELEICGADSFKVQAAKGSTKIELEGDWPSPNFTLSDRLPVSRTVTKEGFKASWFIPFTQGQSSSSTKQTSNLIGFSYKNPVDLYDLLLRSVTYGFMFIIIPFLALFLFEIFAKINFHPVHYLLSGAACVVFFLLLLSFSEHMNFTAAYFITAIATAILVSVYAGLISRKIKVSFILIPVFTYLYAFLFISLKSEDYALLLGSIFIFMVLAILMFCTRKIDWSNLGKKEENTETVLQQKD
ncbi:MAG: cell envelope integrity protein CreD [Treponema sp.]|nr:cell envelope integrity protein CreD [Treponema sp.]